MVWKVGSIVWKTQGAENERRFVLRGARTTGTKVASMPWKTAEFDFHGVELFRGCWETTTLPALDIKPKR